MSVDCVLWLEELDVEVQVEADTTTNEICSVELCREISFSAVYIAIYVERMDRNLQRKGREEKGDALVPEKRESWVFLNLSLTALPTD